MMSNPTVVTIAELVEMDPMRIEVSQAMRFNQPANELSTVRVLSIYKCVVTHGAKRITQKWVPVIKNLSFEDGQMSTAELLRQLAEYLDSTPADE